MMNPRYIYWGMDSQKEKNPPAKDPLTKDMNTGGFKKLMYPLGNVFLKFEYVF